MRDASLRVKHLSHSIPETSSVRNLEEIAFGMLGFEEDWRVYKSSEKGLSSVALQHLVARSAEVTTGTLPPAPS